MGLFIGFVSVMVGSHFGLVKVYPTSETFTCGEEIVLQKKWCSKSEFGFDTCPGLYPKNRSLASRVNVEQINYDYRWYV